MLTLLCTQDERLRLAGTAEGGHESALAAAWERGEAAALVWLATEGMAAPMEASLAWLREWAAQFFTRLCKIRQPTAVEPPTEVELRDKVQSTPPMQGAEYISPALLIGVWERLRTHVSALVGDSLAEWLLSHGNRWHLVGRVTLHLAENKRDAARPFAFLATFTETLSATGQPQHLPLARALQRYTADKDPIALEALLKPVQLAAQKSEFLRDMRDSRRLFQALAWTPAEAYQLLQELPVLQECGLVVKLPDWWQSGRPPRPVVQVTLDVAETPTVGVAAMLSFNVRLSMEGVPLTPEEIAKIKASTSGLVTLRGKWVEVDREQLDQILTHWSKVQQANALSGLGFHEGMRYLSGFGPSSQAPGNSGIDEKRTAWSEVLAGKSLHQLLEQLAEPEPQPQPLGLRTVLRPYQLRGFAWLHFLHRLGLGACLADDMGLGKTVQVIALLLSLKEKGVSEPSLIVAPASLLGNWRAELAKFAPGLRVFTAHSSAASPADLTTFANHPDALLKGVDTVITTYHFVTGSPTMTKLQWQVVALDEAQAVKNPGTEQARAVKKLKARARIALTGTPVENRPGDLWSLFDFLNPGLLGSASAFAETIKHLGAEKGPGFAPLRRLVQPYILRRMKNDRRIIQDLPDKVEVTARCPLTRKQATIYTRLVEELRRTLTDESLPPLQRNGQLLGFLLKFKQVCNHPSHWNGDEQYKPEDSGKFMRLAEICTELAERQERAVIFTQFAELCAPLAQYLSTVFNRPGLVLNGSTPVRQRSALVEQFQASGGPPFFVVSVKAGGTGLNLTAANHVIHFDRWWNPAVENQATDRAYRIGQRRNVVVHKFIVPGTIEERVDRLIQDKTSLARELLGTGGTAEKLLTDMSSEELLRMVTLDLTAAWGD